MYVCDNDAGQVAWSLCNSSDSTSRVCVSDICVEESKEETKGWSVEINYDNDVKFDEINITGLTESISLLSGISAVDIKIGVKTDDKGNVVSIIAYVENEKSALAIESSLKNLPKGTQCQYGVLCRTKTISVHGIGVLSVAQSLHHPMKMFAVALFIIIIETTIQFF